MSQQSFSFEEGFWRLLLGKKFDNLSKSKRTLDNLASEFYSGRKEFIDPKYGSEDGFIEALQGANSGEAQQILLTIWAEKKWKTKSSGDEFTIETVFSEEMDRLREEGLYIEELSDGFTLAWPSQEVRMPTLEDDGVRSQLLEEARPLFLKTENKSVEVRGSNRRVNRFVKDFTDSESVKPVERDSASKSIVDGLSTIFSDEIDSLKLVEIKFRDTNLPDSSALTLGNPTGVRSDLNSEDIRPDLVDVKNLSSLDYLKFRHSKTGKHVSLKVHRRDSGFYFEIQDSYISEEEKENIKSLLEDKLDISFRSIYPYDVQHQEPYLVHQILAENVETYNRYYEELSDENKEFLQRYIEVIDTEVFACWECNEEQEGEKPEQCPECGNDTFRERTEREIEIDDEQIHEEVLQVLSQIDETIATDGPHTLLDLSIESFETTNNEYARATFNQVQSAGAADTHQYEYFTYALGNGQLPYRINRYLLNTVLVTYGKAYIKGRDDFGTIDLYRLIRHDDFDLDVNKLFAEAVLESRSKLRNRVLERSTGAYDQLQELKKKVDNSEFEDLTKEERDELKEEYDSDDFERDVFYILKSIFLFTERWGRPGKTETDGCLVIPHDGGYYVSGYDPKLTYDFNGYDLNSSEKKKAAYYILSESKDEYIKEVLKDGSTVDGHIFVSDIFREGQFSHVASHVQEWFSLVESDEEAGIDVPVVFLSLEQLLEIYEVFDSNYEYIEEYPDIKSAFRNEFISRLRDAKNGYAVVDEEATEQIREKVLQARGNVNRSRDVQQHGN